MDFTSIFLKQTEYSIQRIEEKEEGWNLYPEGETKTPIFISFSQYAGKMPPKFRFFWQKRKLVLTKYENFVISIALDGVLLFEVKKEAYPQELKDKIATMEQEYQKYLEEREQADEQLKKDLAEYLPLLPGRKTLESDLSTLRVPLRAYLKLHLFKGTHASDLQQRIALMFTLCQMAERIYKRHVKETDKKHSLDLSCTFASLKYDIVLSGEIIPNYHFDMKKMEEAVGQEEAHKTYEPYYEAEQLINDELLSCQDNVKRYLIYVVLQLLKLYAKDWDELQSHFSRDGWSNLRRCSDEEDFLYQYKKMKLLHYKNFILPEEIPQNEIDDFMKRFNLA